MRFKHALKLWLIIFLVGFIGLFIFSLLLHNPGSVEIAAYGEVRPLWYSGLFALIIRLLPVLLFITVPFFPLGLILYRPATSQNELQTESKTFGLALFKKKTMIPAYITTVLTYVSLYVFISMSDMSGMGALVVGAMLMLFLVILVPINIVVWIMCMRRSRLT